MQFDTSKTRSVDDVGGNRPLPGKYHVSLVEVKWGDNQKTLTMEVVYHVLSGTVPGQVGKRILDWLTVSEKVTPRFIRLGMCVGLIQPHQQMNVDDDRLVDFFSQAAGRDLIVLMEAGTYEGKPQVKIPFSGMWPVGHADVRDVPLGERPHWNRPAPAQTAPSGNGGFPANYGMPINAGPPAQDAVVPAPAGAGFAGPAQQSAPAGAAASPWGRV